MYIVIGGGGLTGGTLARRLVENRHDVVVVEQDKEACEKISARIGALAIHGNATSIETLEDAGIGKADVAVGAMPVDADNLAFALLARNAEVPRVVVRMRNPRYETAYQLAGVVRAVNVGDLFVRQLVLEIEQPTLRQVATFGKGKASIVVVAIPEGAAVHGETVKDIAQHTEFPNECVIAGIFREEGQEFIIPRGERTVLAGDQVFLAAETTNVGMAAKFLLRTKT